MKVMDLKTRHWEAGVGELDWQTLPSQTHVSIKQSHKSLCPHGKGRKGKNPSTGKVK